MMKPQPPTLHDVSRTPEMAAVYRVTDANANRAAEGLRVVEEYLRFRCEDAFLCQTCKQLRHDLAATVSQLSRSDRLTCRSTLSDVGAEGQTDSEYDRQTLYDLANANLHRAAQALRVLEEFAKLVSQPVAKAFEALRYRTYTLEKVISHQKRAEHSLAQARLYVLADLTLGTGAEFEQLIARLLSSGVDILQLRDKSRSDRELIAAARSMRRLTADTSKMFFVNDRPDIAQLVAADGVHVGQDEITVADVRSLVGPNMLIGVSTHDLDQAQQAVLAGADYLGVGPVFPSATKDFPNLAGIGFVEDVSRQIGLPAFAIGGIHQNNVQEVLATGATRIAVSAAVWAAEDPARAARQLRHKMDVHQE